MKNRSGGVRKGRKPKTTRTLKIELHPKAYSWLESLHAKGRFGNSVEGVAVNLLNDRFKQLFQEGELYEAPTSGATIPFPNPKHDEETNQVTTERPTQNK